MSTFRPILGLLLFLLAAPATAAMPRVIVERDHFVLSGLQHQRFVAWGHNHGYSYGHGLENLDDPSVWQRIERDLADMKRMGANVVRIHLEVGDVMSAADRVNESALKHLDRLLAVAERERIYLDVTGLNCFRPKIVPAWYNARDDEGRWAVQARFWEAVAARCANSDAIFCYDLMNEPLAPGGKREPGQWQTGKLFGGYDFFQWIALDPKGRTREQIAVQWIRRMTAAIRAHDKTHLITVGIPWAFSLPNISGFEPAAVGPELDFLSIHIYPEQGKLDESLALLKTFTAVGKPVVVEETFPLSCDVATEEQFIRRAARAEAVAAGEPDHPPLSAPAQQSRRHR